MGYDETIAGVGAPELHFDRVVTRRNIRKNELVGMRGSVEIVDRGICHLGRDSDFGIIEESANPHCTVGSGCEGLRRKPNDDATFAAAALRETDVRFGNSYKA